MYFAGSLKKFISAALILDSSFPFSVHVSLHYLVGWLLLILFPSVMLNNVAARSSVFTCSLKRLDDSEGRKGCEINRAVPTLRLYYCMSVCTTSVFTPLLEQFSTKFWVLDCSKRHFGKFSCQRYCRKKVQQQQQQQQQ